MRILFIGDIMGKPGRDVVAAELPRLREQLGLDIVIANGENAAGGFGLTQAIAREFFATGIDVISTGNHWADQKEILSFIGDEDRILRPVNYPKGTPGRGANLYQTRKGERVLVINVMGRVFMDALDDPFAGVEAELSACPLGEAADAIVVDIHAEATSEKMAMGHFCDGRASLVVGSHSHVPTADAQIFPGGTAYQTDAGACADYDSVIGMEKYQPVQRFVTKMSSGRFSPATGPATLCAVFVETNAKGLAARIEPVRLGGRLETGDAGRLVRNCDDRNAPAIRARNVRAASAVEPRRVARHACPSQSKRSSRWNTVNWDVRASTFRFSASAPARSAARANCSRNGAA